MDTFFELLPAILVILGGVFGILKLVNNTVANQIGEVGEDIVTRLADVANPDTNGGAGRGPDEGSD